MKIVPKLMADQRKLSGRGTAAPFPSEGIVAGGATGQIARYMNQSTIAKDALPESIAAQKKPI
jgi:hypothetical protein|tara:strand:+ start:486 stop:674 length:189 start_codon:yes stop_codon:yes gene_type:complete